MRIVVTTDGSKASEAASRHVAKLATELAKPPQVLLVYVDEPLLQRVAIELGVKGVDRYHKDNGKVVMKGAKARLSRAGVNFEEHLLIGDPAEELIKFLKKSKCDLLVMGSHGRSALKSLFLGSVTIKLLSRSEVPVVVVR
jgi:nucleotide-binding universal stress UspA family protein